MQTKTAQESPQLFKALGIGLLFKIFYFKEILQLFNKIDVDWIMFSFFTYKRFWLLINLGIVPATIGLELSNKISNKKAFFSTWENRYNVIIQVISYVTSCTASVTISTTPENFIVIISKIQFAMQVLLI